MALSQIEKVMYYIEQNLDDEFDIVTLSKVAGYSKYHFCRIFKVSVGESVMSYVVRLRLQKAARELSYDKSKILEVALNAGYKTQTGFIKAFKKRFATTPIDYKSSKKLLYKKIKVNTMIQPEILQREDTLVIFKRETGHYMKSSPKAWGVLTEQIISWVRKSKPNKNISMEEDNAQAYGICHDNPSETDEENIRYDASIAWEKETVEYLATQGFDVKNISGGRYVKLLYKGGYEIAEESWNNLYAWIAQNNYEFRDEPAFEKYLNRPDKVSEDELRTEIYIPIK